MVWSGFQGKTNTEVLQRPQTGPWGPAVPGPLLSRPPNAREVDRRQALLHPRERPDRSEDPRAEGAAGVWLREDGWVAGELEKSPMRGSNQTEARWFPHRTRHAGSARGSAPSWPSERREERGSPGLPLGSGPELQAQEPAVQCLQRTGKSAIAKNLLEKREPLGLTSRITR